MKKADQNRSVPHERGDFVAPWVLTTSAGEISPRRLALLEAIGECGSISAAARKVGITYKAAWDAVDAMNNLAGCPLVSAQHGGRGGGGAELTDEGRQLVRDLQQLRNLQQAFIESVTTGKDGEFDLDDSLRMLRRLTSKTSARNVLSGRIAGVTHGAVNAEVSIRLGGDDQLIAICTEESTRDLGLAVGREVQALINASWIILADADSTGRTSARNRLCGIVQRITPGAVNAEVVIRLDGGNTLAAIITSESLQAMELEEGKPICALIKASNIILSVQED